MSVVIGALYQFVRLEDYQALRAPLLAFMEEQGIRGTLLLAHEGINGTVSGTPGAMQRLRDWLAAEGRFDALEYKESRAPSHPFLRTKVKLKREIVTMGEPDVDPNRIVGTYLSPREWDAVVDDPETLVIDTRNQYEYEVGTFSGAANPATDSFREFPDYVRRHLDPEKHRKVAMFCTGGIRCEKATAFMKELGFEEVYHLQGGILRYLEETPESDSRWQGECFVFDDRVAVNHRLEPGGYDQCHACRRPVTEQDKASPLYRKGVSCPRCHDETDEQTKARFAERQKQIELARQRGESHLGHNPRGD